jgi:hypothetical protein
VAEIVNHRRQPKNLRGYQAKLKVRLELLPNFPVGTEISFTGDDDSLGVVIGHDLSEGRVKAGKWSYDPNDIKVLIPAKP